MTRPLPPQIEVLLQVASILDDLGIEFHVGGSFASAVHGEPRQTRDIDLVIALREPDVGPLVVRLGDGFYSSEPALRAAIRDRRASNLVHLASGIKIDLFVRGDAPFDRSEFERAGAVDIGGDPSRSVRVKSPEDTVLRKLLWYRAGGHASERQWRDVVGVLKTQAGRLDAAYLEHWAADLGLADLLGEALRESAGGPGRESPD
jgi:hypothetical protein